MKMLTTLKRSLLITAALSAAAVTLAGAVAPALPDFSGLWRLNDQLSDSPNDIAARLRAERTREQTAAQLPASASTSGTPVASQAAGGHRSHGGGGMGGGGGGHGRGGNRGGAKASTSDAAAAVVDTPPPLLADDALLNVQQDAQRVQVALSDTDRMDARLDGVAQQSLSGSAVVQLRRDANSMEISMQFDGGTRLDEYWVKSPDDHHLVVTEQWTTPAVKQPIVFKRSYDRLDI